MCVLLLSGMICSSCFFGGIHPFLGGLSVGKSKGIVKFGSFSSGHAV